MQKARPAIALMLASARSPPSTMAGKHHRLDAGRQPDDSELARRVTKCSAFSLAIAAGALSAVYVSDSNPTLQGWVAAGGAALVFGGSSLPAKHPAAVAASTLSYQVWGTVGNVALNLLLLLLLHVPIRWDWWGVAGAWPDATVPRRPSLS